MWKSDYKYIPCRVIHSYGVGDPNIVDRSSRGSGGCVFPVLDLVHIYLTEVYYAEQRNPRIWMAGSFGDRYRCSNSVVNQLVRYSRPVCCGAEDRLYMQVGANHSLSSVARWMRYVYTGMPQRASKLCLG